GGWCAGRMARPPASLGAAPAAKGLATADRAMANKPTARAIPALSARSHLPSAIAQSGSHQRASLVRCQRAGVRLESVVLSELIWPRAGSYARRPVTPAVF